MAVPGSMLALYSGLAAVLAVSLGWASLPDAGGSRLDVLRFHSWLICHLAGWTSGGYGRSFDTQMATSSRPANGSIREVHGFVTPQVFREQYLWKEPVVFRRGATPQHGFDLECLTGSGDLLGRLRQEFAGRKLMVLRDGQNTSTLDKMTFEEYEELSSAAALNKSLPMPYARALAMWQLDGCAGMLQGANLSRYHSKVSAASLNYLFLSVAGGTTSSMHGDTGDVISIQVHGRKRWQFVQPAYLRHLGVFAERSNIAYNAGVKIPLEPAPSDVPVLEVILNPGDILYFPPMAFHSVENIDPTTLAILDVAGDPFGAMHHHWLLTLGTVLNPRVAYKLFSQVWKTGRGEIDGGYDAFSSKET